MTFLKEFKTLVLPDSIVMEKVCFGYYINCLSDTNLIFLKNELSQINVELEAKIHRERRFYLRAINFKFSNINYEGPSKIKLDLQGYKEKNGIKSPIWKMKTIYNVYFFILIKVVFY